MCRVVSPARSVVRVQYGRPFTLVHFTCLPNGIVVIYPCIHTSRARASSDVSKYHANSGCWGSRAHPYATTCTVEMIEHLSLRRPYQVHPPTTPVVVNFGSTISRNQRCVHPPWKSRIIRIKFEYKQQTWSSIPSL
ncbi:hypothetical protein CRM22_007361 [Opisthorchis felineus]|uniref:Uncharacterized protein n=1 Tax=Opisthorchis felineus TaxID=147828 RepID=A0A4S2LGV8_OPIFE|nr:hypothetical protein CRM22_007361 [Opisthorchis felineus]